MCVEECFICYFDVLGYKSKMDNVGEDAFLEVMLSVKQLIQEAFEIIKSSAIAYFGMEKKTDVSEELGKQICLHVFSDNFCISISKPDLYEDSICLFWNIVTAIMILQKRLLVEHDIFIRGALNIGNVYREGNFIYGSGLIDAYKIENDVSIYPRIVVGNSCMDFLHEGSLMHKKYVKSMIELIKRCIIVDEEDYQYFLNYLIDFVNEPKTRTLGLEQSVKKHEDIVAKNLECSTNERVKDKYEWARKYHNEVCKQYDLKELLL